MRHLRLSGKQSARIRGLLSLRDFDFSGFSESRIRRLVAAAGQYAEDLVPLLSVGDFFSLPRGTEERAIEAVENILQRGDCLSVSALAVNGRMLMELGFGGREIGTVLEKLLEAVLEEPSRNTSEELLSLARAMKNQ